MKEYRGRRGIAPLILNIGARWRGVVKFMPSWFIPRERTPITIEEKAGWAQELVWNFCRREKSLAPTGI
jgi:hypothetical protein